MPYVEQSNALDVWARRARRVLVNGPPNSGKTTALRTWPRPIIIVSYPNERGTTSIPQGEGVRALVWDGDIFAQGDYISVLAEVNKVTHEVIAGKHGEARTLAFDGLHKFFDLCLAAVTGGVSMTEKDFDGLKYRGAGNLFDAHIQKVLSAPVEHVVFNVWDGLEKDDPDAKGTKEAPVSRHIFPELPGKAAKRVMGEFAVVLYAIREGSGGAAQYKWQTQPFGKVWGAGTKMPLEIAKRLPMTVPQDWPTLEKLLIPNGASA